jgi:hypothetical protein
MVQLEVLSRGSRSANATRAGAMPADLGDIGVVAPSLGRAPHNNGESFGLSGKAPRSAERASVQ